MEDTTMQDAAKAADAEIAEGETATETPTAEVTSSEGEAGQAQQPQQTPAPSKLDPIAELDKLNLDPAVKQELKNGFLRQADYTRKTQEVAEAKRLAEEYTSVRPLLEQLSKDPYVQKNYLGQGENPQQDPQIPDDPREYAEWVKAQTIAEMRQEQAFERDLENAAKVDPRLNQDDEFAQIIAGLVAQDEGFRTGQKTAQQATQDAISRWDNYSNTMSAKVKKDLEEKARSKKMLFPQSGSPANTASGAPATIQEAATQAMEELGG